MSATNANLIGLGTITRREVVRILRIWSQTLLPSAITMTLYFVIFGRMVGSRIGEIAPGIGYIDYIVPGLIMMAVITNSYGNISSSFFGAKFQRFVEEMLVSPMPSWVILTGYISGAVLRGLIVAVIVLAISLFFTRIHLYHPLVTFSTVLLTAVVFSLAGFVNAVFAKKFDDIALVPTFVLTPLTYLGGEAVQSALGISDKVARVFQGMLLFFVLGCDTLIHYRIRLIGLALTKSQAAAKLEAAPKLKEAR